MSRFEITLGLLAILATIAVTGIYGLNEEARMEESSRGWEVRHVETGAALFDQYCANCHGRNAGGAVCPPLDEMSGLHGGDLGSGVAWRLEELGWDRAAAFEYVYSSIESGRAVSTRPERFPGNRVAGLEDSPMAMPAWGQDYGGPLRPDQIMALSEYIAAFRDYLPDDREEAVAYLESGPPEVVAPKPTPRPTAVAEEPGEGEEEEEGEAVEADLADLLAMADDAAAVARGEELYATKTCVACHTLPGVSEMIVGPDLTGLAARAGERVGQSDYDGEATTAYEYLVESMRNPLGFIIDGYTPVMPDLGLSAAEIDDLIAYLISQGG